MYYTQTYIYNYIYVEIHIHIYVGISLVAKNINDLCWIFVEIVEFMTMLKHRNRKVQMQLVSHSLPSIAVSKRNELVDGSWAPQLVQFISQYFSCAVITLLWMWSFSFASLSQVVNKLSGCQDLSWLARKQESHPAKKTAKLSSWTGRGLAGTLRTWFHFACIASTTLTLTTWQKWE